MQTYILALDQGTTSSRAIIFDEKQNIVITSQKELNQFFPKEGWVEHDPLEIYNSQHSVMIDALLKSQISPKQIAGIGVTNQRETTILWNKATGNPIHNAIVWQCRRTANEVENLRAKGLSEYIRDTTGLVLDAYFSATKIKWILDNTEGAREAARRGEILFGTVDSWLVWKLTNGAVHITDYTNASRTMLYDIHNLCWDEKLLEELDIPKEILPKVRSSSEIYGYANIQGTKIPIAGIAGDQQAALFGQCCFERGDIKNTYGTGCFLLMNTGNEVHKSENGLLTTMAVSFGGKIQYALEGSVFIGGAVIQWLRDEMGLITDSTDAEYFASKVPNTGGVYFVPAFSGLGAPHWDMHARGLIIGITRGTEQTHIIRAAQEAIAYQSHDLVRILERETNTVITELNVDGGASRDNFLMQFQADILNAKVIRPMVRETTALGAASLAGLAVGLWKDLNELKTLRKHDMAYMPNMEIDEREKLLLGWNKAVKCSLGFAN